MKIRKNDKVKVITGKYKGIVGVVSRANNKNSLLYIKDVNVVIKHIKTQGSVAGGRVKIEKPIDVSKVVLVCPKCEKPTRVGIKIEGKSKKRFCKKCKEVL